MSSHRHTERRKLFRRLVALAGLGITGFLLSQDKVLLPEVKGANGDPITVGGSFTGTAQTLLTSSTTASAFAAINSDSIDNYCVGLYGESDSPFAFGVKGQTSSASGTGIYGLATATTGNTYGASGASLSTLGTGVYGVATATTGFTIGVYGLVYSPVGTGVEGLANATTGATTGVYGEADSPIGVGVEGYAAATTGKSIGTYGQALSPSGIGVYGTANATTGSTFGVYALAYSSSGIGVEGVANATTGNTTGVVGESDSSSGIGVYGIAPSSTGLTIGVHGQSNSSSGIGVYGAATASGGTALFGAAGDDGAIPVVARANSGNQSANLQEWQNSSGTALSVVNSSGWVGVGTATPEAPLTVVSPTSITAALIGTSQGNLIFAKSGTNGFSMYSNAANYLGFYSNDSGIQPLTMNGSGVAVGNAYSNIAPPSNGAIIQGDVGIGTSSPTHLIQLSGGAYSDGSTWTPSSSIRWKENITPLTVGIETLKRLRPVAYNYKKTPEKKTMGFIAEEVGKVLPTIVDWDTTEPGYAEGYDHLAILALSVAALKEQQATILQQQREIRKLTEQKETFQTELRSVKARLSALEEPD